MLRSFLAFFISIALCSHAIAQQVRPATSAEIYRNIAQLKNLTRVLYLAAHPDDENTRLLAWMVNDQHIRTAYLSLTRGDGGQNILGSEQGAALGLIRTHELLEARKIDGAEQFFTRAVDFGFSKTYTETFKHWDEDLLVKDVVRIMREYRPDVIICRFPPNEQAGHGQHAASAIIARKAFDKVSDENYVIDGMKPWKPKRLLWNTFKFGDRNTTSEDQFKARVGNYSPALGMGYGELAGISRSIHRSQGAGTPSVPGVQTEYFKLVAGDSLSESFFDGVDITWNRVRRPEIGDRIDEILQHYNHNHPERSIPALLDLREEITTVKNSFWRTEKLAELDKIILDAAGIMVEVAGKAAEANAGDTARLSAKVITRNGKVPVKLERIEWNNTTTTSPRLTLQADSLYSFDQTITLPNNTAVTEPYWLSKQVPGVHFNIPADSLIGLPVTPNNLQATVYFKIGGEDFTLNAPVSFKKLDPLKGDVVEALRITPNATIDFESPLLITDASGNISGNLRLHTSKSIRNCNIIISGDGFQKNLTNINLRAGIDTLLPFTIAAADIRKTGKQELALNASLLSSTDVYARAMHVIRYDHLPTLQYFTPPSTKALQKDWKVSVKRIGYLEGAGDNVVTILRQCGLQVDILKEADLTNAQNLLKYDAIITGIRAVNTRKEMKYWLPVLHRYAELGGTLVMQYNTLQDMSTTNLGPYPFTLTSQRVTEEDATVTFIKDKHRLLNYPNKISNADFNGWVQERGLYYPKEWDSHYTALLRMNDTDEKPLDGALLYTPYGKGHYIYTSLAFFRQLPAGNKGSIRLLMNLLSVGK